MGFTVEEVLENERTIYILKGDDSVRRIPKGYFANLDMFDSENSEEQIDAADQDSFRITKMKVIRANGTIEKVKGLKADDIAFHEVPKSNFWLEHPEYRNMQIDRVDLSQCINLEIIPERAFECSLIESIIFAPNIIKICVGAFEECKKLKKADLSKCMRLTNIDKSAFSDSGLEEAILPKNVKEIRNCVFRNCKKLKTVDFSNCRQLKTVFPQAFFGSAIENLTFPQSIKAIYQVAFWYCEELARVDLSSCINLEYIDPKAFLDTNVKTVILPKNFLNDKTEDQKNQTLQQIFGSHKDLDITYANNAVSKNDSADVASIDFTSLYSSSQNSAESEQTNKDALGNSVISKEDCM